MLILNPTDAPQISAQAQNKGIVISTQKEKDMKKKPQLIQKVKKLATPMTSDFDVNGSYTGNPTNGEVITGTPVQDADDL